MTDKFETNLSKVVDSLRTKFVSKDDIETKLNSLDIFTKVEDLQLKMKDMSVTLENQKAEANFAVKVRCY